ncbi:MAG: pyrimidine dimer DNA glycosylase/endonuclease V [Christensenellales bacterium]
MQVFLPYPEFSRCAASLDNKRLNKQIVELCQLLNIRANEGNDCFFAHSRHPVYKHYRDKPDFLLSYLNKLCPEYYFRFSKLHNACFTLSGYLTFFGIAPDTLTDTPNGLAVFVGNGVVTSENPYPPYRRLLNAKWKESPPSFTRRTPPPFFGKSIDDTD